MFVLDNSVLLGMLVKSQATDYSEAIFRRLRADKAVAPTLLWLEAANALRTLVKRQRVIAGRALEMLDYAATLPITFESVPQSPAMLLQLAVRYDLTAYDAAYLETALRLTLPIATQDAALAAAAVVAGVGVVRV
jgi:predicted nucleic acid-binding protein